MLDQTPLAQRILEAPTQQRHTVPPLGAYKTFQVPIGDISRLTDLAMPDLIEADVLELTAASRAATGRHEREWIALNSYDDVALTSHVLRHVTH